MTREIKLNNPGGLEKGADWQGLTEDQPDPRFCKFASPLWGIRALVKVLRNYQDKHSLNTITGIINRWAPANENDTQAYIDDVAKRMRVMADSPIDLHDRVTMFLLVESIIWHENGQMPYGGDVINSAITLAGAGS